MSLLISRLLWPAHSVRLVAAAFCLCDAFLALAEGAPRFDIPVRCELGRSCFIQNYFDHAEGAAYKDYRCGHLSYDGHNGTDFRVINEIDMRHGVEVVASKSGRVIGVRDGEPDGPISLRDPASIKGKEAGNGVVIDHGNGWHTQYSHLRNGSVQVALGDLVTRGQTIGLIGESGNADFPHVEFVVRHNGKPIDPFWPDDSWNCGAADSDSLWQPSTLKKLDYIGTMILQTGFSNKPLNRFEIQAGDATRADLPSSSKSIFLWAEIMGANDGDVWHTQITAPNGSKLVNTSGTIHGNKAISIVMNGRPIGKAPWVTGRYQGRVSVKRNGSVLMHKTAQFHMVPCSNMNLPALDYNLCFANSQ